MKTSKKEIFYIVLGVLLVIALGSRVVETGDPSPIFVMSMSLAFIGAMARG